MIVTENVIVMAERLELEENTSNVLVSCIRESLNLGTQTSYGGIRITALIIGR